MVSATSKMFWVLAQTKSSRCPNQVVSSFDVERAVLCSSLIQVVSDCGLDRPVLGTGLNLAVPGIDPVQAFLGSGPDLAILGSKLVRAVRGSDHTSGHSHFSGPIQAI